MKKKKKFENGITLIALIITIIVLLIIAGITISSMQNNIISNAENAKIKDTILSFKERVIMAEMSLLLEIKGNLSENKEYVATESENFVDLAEKTSAQFNTTLINNMSNINPIKIASTDFVLDNFTIASNSSSNKINNSGYSVTYYLDVPGDLQTEGEGYIVIYYTDNLLKSNSFTNDLLEKYELTGININETNSQVVLVSALRVENTTCSSSSIGLATKSNVDTDLTKSSFSSTSLSNTLSFKEKAKSTLLTSKMTNNQVMDCSRSPAFPSAGQLVTVQNFGTAFKYNGTRNGVPNNHYVKFTNLGTISTLEDSGLKTSMQSSYPGQDYPVVRLDEYDENDNNIGMFSQAGILYILSEERGVYLFVASSYNSNNSYGYLICLTDEEATSLRQKFSDEMIAGGILSSLDE